MNLIQFNNLNETAQFDVLLKHGAMIGRRKDKKYKYVLYQIDSIYIELQYYKAHKSMPAVRGFTSSGNGLLPYIEDIDLSSLFK